MIIRDVIGFFFYTRLEGMEGERNSKAKGERGQGTGRWHTRGGRVVGGDRRIPSYGGEYRYAREDKDVDVQLLLFESFGGFGKGVGEILWKAANVLQNKLTLMCEPRV